MTRAGSSAYTRLTSGPAGSVTVFLLRSRYGDRTPIVQGRHMANTTSAKKAVRKIERRTAVNRARRSKMRTQIRKAVEAIAEGDAAQALTVVRETESAIMRSVQKGILHKNTASRYKSRLNARVKALAAPKAA